MIYRVEIRKDGAVASCNVVESALKDGGRVFYVDAVDKAEACKKARHIWTSISSFRAQRLADAKKHGLCTVCHKDNDTRRSKCTRCAREHSRIAKEWRAIKRLPESERAAAIAERTEATRKTRVAVCAELARRGFAAAVAATKAKADARWDAASEAPRSPDVRAALRQCLRAYDRDPEGFRNWLLAKLGREVEPSAGPFDDWTDAEIDHYAETGESPQQAGAAE